METRKPLPKVLPGWVCEQFVGQGTKLSGPYWYRLWRDGGRLHKAYVGPEDLEETRAACGRWQELQRGIRRERRQVRESVIELRRMKRILRGIVGSWE